MHHVGKYRLQDGHQDGESHVMSLLMALLPLPRGYYFYIEPVNLKQNKKQLNTCQLSDKQEKNSLCSSS